MTEQQDIMKEEPNQRKNADGREQWPMAIIGLPDSGKSTFLARLYGANLIESSAKASQYFSISFPLAFNPDESSSLEKVKQLWEWICANFDKKLKTIEHAELTLYISGSRIPKGLKISTQDLPGETFQPPLTSDSSGIDHKALARKKRQLHHEYKYLHGAIILVDSKAADQPESNALVKAALEQLPQRTKWGKEPVLKLVAFTKAGTPEPDEHLRTRMQELETLWRKQGQRWVRVVACESIADLNKITDSNGQIRWALPASDQPMSDRKLPEWILSPSSVVLQLPAMLAAYRRRRRWRMRLTTAAIFALLAIGWVLQGQHHDTRSYEEARSRPQDKISKLENYLIGTQATAANFFYPFRRHTTDAAKEWNTCVFDSDLNGSISSLDPEAQQAALLAYQKGAIWKYIDRDKYKECKKAVDDKIARENQRYEIEMGNFEQEAHRSDTPDRFIESKSFTYDLPSLTDKAAQRKRFLLQEYQAEQNSVKDFRVLTAKWREHVVETVNSLQILSTEGPLKFDVLQRQRNTTLNTFAKSVEKMGLEHAPYQSSQLLKTLIPAVEKQMGPEKTNVLAHIKRVLADAEDLINGLDSENESFKGEIDSTDLWADKITLCAEAERTLKDLPASAEWKKQAGIWIDQYESSRKALIKLNTDVDEARATPQKQLELIQAFTSPSAKDHAPEHRRQAEPQISRFEQEIKDINKAWQAVESAFDTFKRDKKSLPALQKSLADYIAVLREQSRTTIEEYEEKYKEINGICEDENSQVRKLIGRYEAQLGTTAEARREVADLLAQLNNTYEYDNNVARIERWLTKIKERGDNMTNCVEVSSDDNVYDAVKTIRLVAEYAGPLNLQESDQRWAEKTAATIKQNWADRRWKSSKDAAKGKTDQGLFKDAIAILRDYKSRDVKYGIFGDDADKNIDDIAAKWEKSIGRDLNKQNETPIRQRIDYEVIRNNITNAIAELGSCYRPSAELEDAARKALESLNKQLIDWRIANINGVLGDLPKIEGGSKVILTRWDVIDSLRQRFTELAEDEVAKSKFKREVDTAKRAGKTLDALRDKRTVIVGIDPLILTMPNNAYTWLPTSHYPEPIISLKLDDHILWSAKLDEKKPSNSINDSKNRSKQYRVTEKEDSEQYEITSSNWDEDRIELSPSNQLCLVVTVKGKNSTEFPLEIVKTDQTAGVLLMGSKLTGEGSVNYHKNKPSMRLKVEVSLKISGAEVFAVPPKFDNWQ